MLLNIVKKAVVIWQNLNSVVDSSLSNLSGHRALVIITRILSSTNEVTTHMKMRLTDRNHKLTSNSEIMLKSQTYLKTREKSPRFVTKRLTRHFLGSHAKDPTAVPALQTRNFREGEHIHINPGHYGTYETIFIWQNQDSHTNEERRRTSMRRRIFEYF